MDARDAADARTLARRAQAGLRAGGTPCAVFVDLAADTLDYRPSALAVCVAAGIPRAQAERRWHDTGEQLLPEIQPGEEALLGDALEAVGLFDVHRPLDEREQQARRHMSLAIAAVGGWPSGYAFRLSRWWMTGRLVDAFVSLTDYGARTGRAAVPPAYWTHLLAAADLLAGTDDNRFESCVLLRRDQLSQSSRQGLVDQRRAAEHLALVDSITPTHSADVNVLSVGLDPNLSIRGFVRDIRLVRHRPGSLVRVYEVSSKGAQIRCRVTSP